MSISMLVSQKSQSNNNVVVPPAASNVQRTPASNTRTTLLPKLGISKAAGALGNGHSTTQQDATSAAMSSSTPGKWQHPRMNEVIQRQSKTRFDNTNMRTILTNSVFMVSSFVVEYAFIKTIPRSRSHTMSPFPAIALLLLRLLFLFRIVTALLPRFRKPDMCEDVPLTPAQRAMLGLPPMSRPATPLEKEQYVTPPRYSRSGTPRSNSNSSLRAQTSGSPLSGRGTPFEPATSFFDVAGSPSSVLRSGSERRRLSYTVAESSPLSIKEFEVAGSVNTPTKSNKASVGLNNKWLYEKSRASPRASPRASIQAFS